MSLINQMLKDLSVRQVKAGQQSHWFRDLNVVLRESPSQGKSRLLMLIGGSVLIFVVLFFFFRSQEISIRRAEFDRKVSLLLSDLKTNENLERVIHQRLLPQERERKRLEMEAKFRKTHQQLQSHLQAVSPPVQRPLVESVNHDRAGWPSNLSQATVRKQPSDQQALKHLPNKGYAVQPAADVKQFTSQQKEQVVLAKRYQQAMHLLSLGQEAIAARQLQSILRVDPTYHQARVALVNHYLMTKQYQQAGQVLQHGRLLKSDYLPYIVLQAEWYTQRHQVKQAIQLLRDHAPDLKAHRQYYALLAGLYQRAGQTLQAVKLYQQLLITDPGNSTWWMAFGLSLVDQGRERDAQAAFQQALKTGRLSPSLQQFVKQQLASMQR